MLATQSPEQPAVAYWDHVFAMADDLSPTAARALLKLKFPPSDIERMRELSAKARRGDLSSSEEIEIDTFERLGCMLDILHSKARCALRDRVKKA